MLILSLYKTNEVKHMKLVIEKSQYNQVNLLIIDALLLKKGINKRHNDINIIEKDKSLVVLITKKVEVA